MSPRDLLSRAVWAKTVPFSDLINLFFSPIVRVIPSICATTAVCEAPSFKFDNNIRSLQVPTEQFVVLLFWKIVSVN